MIETEEGDRQEAALAAPMAASPALRVATPPEDEEGQFEAGVGRSITVELLAAWNTQLRREATARCPVAGCGITFHSAPQIQSHYVTCSGKYDGPVVRCEECQARVPASLMVQHNKVVHQRHPLTPADPDRGTTGSRFGQRSRGQVALSPAPSRVSAGEGLKQHHLRCSPGVDARDTTSSPRTMSLQLDWGLDDEEEVSRSSSSPQPSALQQQFLGERGGRDSWSQPPAPRPHTQRHSRGSLAGEEVPAFMRIEEERGAGLLLGPTDPHSSGGTGRGQATSRSPYCQPARQPCPTACLQPSPSWARRRHLDHHHHHLHHHHHSPALATHSAGRRARRGSSCGPGCPGEEEAGRHSRSPESPCLPSPAGHAWPAPLAERPYSPAVQREALGGWGAGSPGVGVEAGWDEEEQYSAKRRQLAVRAEQLQRAEELVKQQEEEAQQRTWLALQQQEMLLREKEEALKMREAAAQRKLELAARLMEESRMMRGSTRHTGDSTASPLYCPRPPPCPEDSPHQEALRNPTCRWPDAAPHHNGTIHNGCQDGQAGAERGRVCLQGHDKVEDQCPREASPRQQWRPGEGHPPSPRAIIPTAPTQTEPGVMATTTTTPTSHLSETRQGKEVPRGQEESPPRLPTPRVVRTYSRTSRPRPLSDTSQPPPASHVGQNTSNTHGETVVNQGSSITITPLPRPPSRPRRPYSALPTLQTTSLPQAPTASPSLTVSLASPSPSPAVTAPSPASTSPPRELAPRQLSFMPPLSLGSQQFTIKYVGAFKPTPTTPSTRVKATPSPPRLSEAFCKPGREVVAPKVTILPRTTPATPTTLPHTDKGMQATQVGWPQSVTATNSPAPLLAAPPPHSLPFTTHTTVHVDPADSSTLQIHVDSPFHPPQPCHTHLTTTTTPDTTIPQATTAASTITTTPPHTQSSSEDEVHNVTQPQHPEDTQAFTDIQVQHLEVDTAEGTAEDTGKDTAEEPYPPQIPQDIMKESTSFEGEFDPSTFPCSSPALMQSFLSDAVAFHASISSPSTLQDPHKDATLLYQSQSNIDEQTLKDTQDMQDTLSPTLPADKTMITDPPEGTVGDGTLLGASTLPAGRNTQNIDTGSFSPVGPTQDILSHTGTQGDAQMEVMGGAEMEESFIHTQPLHCSTSPEDQVECLAEDDLSYPEDVEMEEVDIRDDDEEPANTSSLFIANPAQAEGGVEGSSILSTPPQTHKVEENVLTSAIEAEVEESLSALPQREVEVEVEGNSVFSALQTATNNDISSYNAPGEIETPTHTPAEDTGTYTHTPVEEIRMPIHTHTPAEDTGTYIHTPAEETETHIHTPVEPAEETGTYMHTPAEETETHIYTPAEETETHIHIHTPAEETGTHHSDIFCDNTVEAGEEAIESGFPDTAEDVEGVDQLGCDWGVPQAEGDALESEGEPGSEDAMPGNEASEEILTNTDLVLSPGSGHYHQVEEEVAQAGVMDTQLPEMPQQCQSDSTVPPELNQSLEDASQGAKESNGMPITTPWHSSEPTPAEGHSATMPVTQKGHTTPECEPVTLEPEEMETVVCGGAQRGKRGRGRGRAKVRGQTRWTRRRNTGRTKPGQVDDADLTSEDPHVALTLCVTPGSDGKASERPATEPQVAASPPQDTTVSTLDMEAATPPPPDTEVEEAVEHVSRGGRKVKLKDWWTGVVSEATSPRTKTTARSPITSPARSPIRSPGPKKPRVKRSPAEASETPQPKRRCEEAPMLTDMLTTTAITTPVITTPVITTPATTTPATTTPATTTPATTTPATTTPATTTPAITTPVITTPATTTAITIPATTTPAITTPAITTPAITIPTTTTPVPPPHKAAEGSHTPTPEVPVKRRRGRQPKSQRPLRDYKPSRQEKFEDVECGKCGEMCFSQAHFLSHARRTHNGLARPRGSSQEFTAAETQEILVDTMRAVRQLRCEVCGGIFRSVLGHRMHSLACGVDPSQLNKTCHVCHRRIRYYYLEAHLRKHDSKAARKPKESATPKDRERGSRKAALNCNMRLQAWRHTRGEDGGSDSGSDQGDDFRQELRLAHYYTRPDLTLPHTLLDTWEATLEEGAGATCHHQGCDHSSDSVAEARQHHWLCPQAGHSLEYSCKLCAFTCGQEADMEDHLTSTHIAEVGGEPDSESDESDEEWGERLGGQRSSGLRRYSRDLLVPFLPALRWTHDFLADNTSNSLYPEHWPAHKEWQALAPGTAALYLPAIAASPRFRVQVVGQQAAATATVANGDSVSQGEWQELGRFDSMLAGQGSAMFCGGPVTASAWCPEYPPASLHSSMQHLALATLPCPDMKHQICHSYSHRGLIQLWGCPGPTTSEPPTPCFLLGLAHQHGTVWSLAWCPSGSEEATLPGLVDSPLPRLGLLAAACSDGTVQVYAVPRPEALLERGAVYKPSASLALVPGRGEGREVQCLKVDWCRAKGHHLVAGALSSGVVCVWDLTTTSPFLRLQGGSVVVPFRSFHAHNGVCTTVAFCPTTGGRNLLSGGNDRTYKFWDLERPELPLSVVRKGLVLDSLWLLHWAGCFLAFDDVYGLASTNTCFKESGFFGIPSRNVLSANAAVWALAGSDWLNSVAQGDSAGEVTLTVQQQLFRNYENEKFPSKRKVPVMCARLQALDAATPVSFNSGRIIHRSRHEPQAAKAKSADQQREQNEQEEEDCLGQNLYRKFPQTYQETVDTHGLVFKEQNVANFCSIPREELLERWRNECMEASAITCYPMMAVTSLAWNNNLGAHTWIAVATQSGLVRLVRVEGMHNAAMDSFINDNFTVRR